MSRSDRSVTALQIENFLKDREQRDKKSSFFVEEKPQANCLDVDSIIAAIEALPINCIKQETSDTSRLDVIEMEMKEITRMVKQLVDKQTMVGHPNDRNQNFTRDSRYQRQSSNN
ncbi:12187_t:CDS:2 [Dentiscutata heterogama]|uniref:12187_t:CDS:1 n=1 Tax=Dentiscutata heterogama TaxID=1316150 RepID=A0ACA9KKK7_9GLOM|nr:12187_t:CDS:2 [Dentiscutata heterogama]